MSFAGRLKTRLVLQAPVETPDGAGGVSRDYSTAAIVWAAVTPLGGRAAVEADGAGSLERYRILLRAGAALTLQHRFVDGDRIYRITGWRDRESGRFVEIDAEIVRA